MLKKRSLLNRKTKGDVVFDIINLLILLFICFVTLYPFYYLLVMSFTSGDVPLTKLYWYPPKITLSNYAKVLSDSDIWNGYKNTIIRTVLGTVISVLCVICTAYPLSKKYLVHRNIFTSFVVITMFVSGGTIPSYLLVKSLNIMNTVWALVLPTAISAYNVVITRNFFMGIPPALEESAQLDGANDIRILFSIYVPVSLPVIATITLWVAVAHWNAWFDSLIYITESNKQVLQIIMRRIVLEGTQDMLNPDAFEESMQVSTDTIKATTVMVTTIPILVVYPFIQKYFVKGVMVGSLKG